MLAAIIGHRDLGGRESIRLDHVRPRVEIGGVNTFDDVRPRQAQKVVIALLILRQIERPAIIRLGQPVLLDRRAIAAVEYHDLFSSHFTKLFFGSHFRILLPLPFRGEGRGEGNIRRSRPTAPLPLRLTLPYGSASLASLSPEGERENLVTLTLAPSPSASAPTNGRSHSSIPLG